MSANADHASRLAVVLMNLGGPASIDDVKPFLRRFFRDPAILRIPAPARFLVAALAARKRAPVAREIYRSIGGSSPLLPNTQIQADALLKALKRLHQGDILVSLAMRHAHPFTQHAAQQVRLHQPHRVVLVPLYPQFSTATTASAVLEWKRRAPDLIPVTRCLCRFEDDLGLARSHAAAIQNVAPDKPYRLLFSAHGLPQRVVDKGDPYPRHVLAATRRALDALPNPPADHVVCYQSRVGPLQWLKPSLNDEISRAGADAAPIVICPVAFVSENSETIEELHQNAVKTALRLGCPSAAVSQTPGADPLFINSLAKRVVNAAAKPTPAACMNIRRPAQVCRNALS